MPKRKTKEEIKAVINDYFSPDKLVSLYNDDAVNYTSSIKGTKRNIYDFIAEELIQIDDNLEKYFDDNITEIKRSPRENGKAYITASHNPEVERNKALKEIERSKSENKSIDEEYLAKSLLMENMNLVGQIIDYQIPIKETDKVDEEEDKFTIGRIDLLAYNEGDDIISLIELKKRTNTETLLRAILEIATYYCQISKDKLKSEYSKKNDANTKVWKIVFVYEDSKQYEQYTNKDSENIRILADKLNVKIFFLDKNNQITEIK